MPTHSTRTRGAEERDLPEVESLRADQAARRQRIIDAAQRFMLDVDYERIQVKDVADEAGVALGTLYRYFSSKDHLFACALVAWSQGFGGHVERRSGGPTVDHVKATYRRAARAFDRQPRVYRMLMLIQSSDDAHAQRAWREFTRSLTSVFGGTLEGSRLTRDKQGDVISVMSAVLDQNLRSWQLGLQPIEAVYTAIDRAADLIFGR